MVSLLCLSILSACASTQPTMLSNQPYLDAQTKIQSLPSSAYSVLDDGTIYLPEPQSPRSQKTGTLITPDGSLYHGEVLHGKAEGFGKSHISTGEIYEGEHKQGYFEGRGNLILSDGSVFKGIFRNNKAYQGDMYFSDGTIAKLKLPLQ